MIRPVYGVFSGPSAVAGLDKFFLLDDADREPVESHRDPYTVGAVRLFTTAVDLGGWGLTPSVWMRLVAAGDSVLTGTPCSPTT
jgi:hypothetical protein